MDVPVEQRGYLDIVHFDRAMVECLGADFIPSGASGATGPNYSPEGDLGFGISTPDGDPARDPGDDPNCKFQRPGRQAAVAGVEGSGIDGRVPVIFNTPEDVYNRYSIPGIRVLRSSIDFDQNRHHANFSGYKYRVPSNTGTEMVVQGPYGQCKRGWTHYVQREHAEPQFITYEIEVRARYQAEAQCLRRYVAFCLRHQTFIPVYDSAGDRSYFTLFRDSIVETSQFSDTLNRFHGYMMTYRLQAELDDYPEDSVVALTSTPQTNIEQI